MQTTRIGSNRGGWRMRVVMCAGVLVAGYGVSLIGCSTAPPTSSHPPASQLSEGLTLLEATDPTWGFNAAYVKAGRVVYIESRTGQPKPEVYRSDAPNDPPNEMDLRFVDQKNHTFWAQRGGDSWVDTSWNIQITQQFDTTLTWADRDQDYTLAQEASTALVAALPVTFKDHNFHLGNFAKMVPPTRDTELLPKIAELNLKSPEPAVDKALGTYSDSTWTQLLSAKYSEGSGCLAWVCGGSHSAVSMYANPNVGYWQSVIAACNHGPCPGTFGAGDCYSWNGGGWFQSASVNGSSATGGTGIGDGQGGCQTSYSWDSGGYDHLCNDDAAYELWQTIDGSQQTHMGFENGDAIGFQYAGDGFCRGSLCGSGSPAYYACDCEEFNGCSGDWNTPYCPGNQTWGAAGVLTLEAAVQSNTGFLMTSGNAGNTNWGLGILAGTSPSLSPLPAGGYQVAFQDTSGALWTVGTLGNTKWSLGVMAGTSPSIAALPAGGFEVAFQGSGNGHLFVTGNAGEGDLGVVVRAGTSPSIAALPGGGYEIAYQAPTGDLWIAGSLGSSNLQLGMAASTSPSIAALPGGGYEIALQSWQGGLWVAGTDGTGSLPLGVMAGTSPSIAALPAGGYEVAFQGSGSGHLFVTGTAGQGDLGLGMMAGTSPSIRALPTLPNGYQIAFQANTGALWLTGTDGTTNQGQAMARGTSPGGS